MKGKRICSRRRFLADAGKMALGGAAIGLLGGCNGNPVLEKATVTVVNALGGRVEATRDIEKDSEFVIDYPGYIRNAVWTVSGLDDFENSKQVIKIGGNIGSFTANQVADYVVFLFPTSVQKYIQMIEGYGQWGATFGTHHNVGFENDADASIPLTEANKNMWKNVMDVFNEKYKLNGVVRLGNLKYEGFSGDPSMTVGFAKQNYNVGTTVRVNRLLEDNMRDELSECLSSTDDLFLSYGEGLATLLNYSAV